MAPASSEPASERLERRAATLLVMMAGAALLSVGAGLVVLWWRGATQAGLGERLLGLATGLVVLAPLVSLVGITVGAMRDGRRLALLALATLLVTLAGMGLAR